MCWRSRKKPIKMISDKDIYVFKICKVLKDGRITPYFYMASDIKKYVESQVYGGTLPIYVTIMLSRDSYMSVIDEGIHSYSIEQLWLRLSNSGFYVGEQLYQNDGIAVVICSIPKGTPYYINEKGEVVSQYIRIIKTLVNPLHPLTLGNINKVNNILKQYG